jgi:hypothetical protein
MVSRSSSDLYWIYRGDPEGVKGFSGIPIYPLPLSEPAHTRYPATSAY